MDANQVHPGSEKILYCVHCTRPLVGRASKRYCNDRCRSAHKRSLKFPPPEYVGDYDLMPDHIKALFTPGDPAECWISKKRSPNGYAINTSVKMHKANAYRLIYMLMVGPIPKGMELDHTCDNGRGGCVNWHHLKVVTHRENMLRPAHTIPGRHIRSNCCIRGHEWTPENTAYEGPNKDQRRCKACIRMRQAATRAKYREKYLAKQRAYDASPRGKALKAARQKRYREQRRSA